jgi:hypothetical protein
MTFFGIYATDRASGLAGGVARSLEEAMRHQRGLLRTSNPTDLVGRPQPA